VVGTSDILFPRPALTLTLTTTTTTTTIIITIIVTTHYYLSIGFCIATHCTLLNLGCLSRGRQLQTETVQETEFLLLYSLLSLVLVLLVLLLVLVLLLLLLHPLHHPLLPLLPHHHHLLLLFIIITKPLPVAPTLPTSPTLPYPLLPGLALHYRTLSFSSRIFAIRTLLFKSRIPTNRPKIDIQTICAANESCPFRLGAATVKLKSVWPARPVPAPAPASGLPLLPYTRHPPYLSHYFTRARISKQPALFLGPPSHLDFISLHFTFLHLHTSTLTFTHSPSHAHSPSHRSIPFSS